MTWWQPFGSADLMPALAWALGAYLLGGLATGYFWVRMRTGQDIRDLGSGSIGARNVGRFAGRSGFFLTLLGDFGKGALAVGLAGMYAPHPLLPAVAWLFVVIGHVWPVALGFRGGKGVATSLGGLLFFDYRIALIYAGLFLLGWLVTRRLVLGSLLAFLLLPAVGYWQKREYFVVGIFAAVAAVVIFAHRQNLAEEFPALFLRRPLTDKPCAPKT
ncbi:MAG TPA: glycerol-3-phosphate acyltransferase [Verrucomicrobiota bacterium]|nr:glycerol-3-phosphate acyltransferase [Verrucomicrobiota bacterium]HNT14827.1 glycerol-3-phosphate acyltransferase [Verrucomicrobiota bacterium]